LETAVVMKKKIMMVFGTRPEAIKMAPLYLSLKALPNEFDVQLCVTAQHREMLDQVLKTFDITPDIDLNLMIQGQDLFDITSSILTSMRNVLREHTPYALLVHGDTTTSFAAAMAGFYLGISVGHIEAGLRTHNLQEPFPEEFNRQVVSKVSKWHFTPTEGSKKNLLDEGINPSMISVTGNTAVDALFCILNRINQDEEHRRQLDIFLNEQLNFDWKHQRIVLITGHRRENFGDGFSQICDALKELALNYPDVRFVYPVHLNPNVQDPVGKTLGGVNNIHLIKPLDYEPFVYLLKHSYFVLTDSGGIQEEAPSLGKPVLVMRNTTERPEAVALGIVRLVGADKSKIVANTRDLLDNQDSYMAMSSVRNPYGDGKACERIISVLKRI
jgi:UDP-N-acetylglucosamine 2-epimerase (non-hydrolysing)